MKARYKLIISIIILVTTVSLGTYFSDLTIELEDVQKKEIENLEEIERLITGKVDRCQESQTNRKEMVENNNRTKDKLKVYNIYCFLSYSIAIITAIFILFVGYLLTIKRSKEFAKLEAKKKIPIILWVIGWLISIFAVISGLASAGKLFSFLSWFLTLTIPVVTIGGLNVYFLSKDK